MAAYTEADTCVCCGKYVPEGRQVCHTCEANAGEKKGEDYGKHHNQVGRQKKTGGIRRPFFWRKYAKQRTP